MNAVRVFESEIQGWPIGPHGVAVSSAGIIVRKGQTEQQRATAIEIGRQLYLAEYGAHGSVTSAPALDRCSPHIKPCFGRDLHWQ